ncbi:MAG: hypothetical protein JXR97_03140 [Planctomycetes bacterium]|nr:hypothetical protein [Planctomycetota bacterium]
MLNESWWTFERGVFVVLSAMLMTASVYYYAFPPALISAEIEERPARSKLNPSDIFKVPDEARELQKSFVQREDPFILPQLIMTKRTPVKPSDDNQMQNAFNNGNNGKPKPQPKPNPNNNVKPIKQEVLPIKPIAKMETPKEGDNSNDNTKEAEKPFPLKVLAIIKGSVEGKRRIHVRSIDGGPYYELSEGDEFKASPDETVVVVEITPTSVTFEREGGELYRVDKDPMTEWKPLLRDEADDAGEEPADSFDFDKFFGEEDTGNLLEKLKKPKGAEKVPDTSKPDSKEKLSAPEIERMIKELKKKNPDLMKQLGEVF